MKNLIQKFTRICPHNISHLNATFSIRFKSEVALKIYQARLTNSKNLKGMEKVNVSYILKEIKKFFNRSII